MLRAYKTELDLNNKQRTMLNQCSGTARFVFNWALADRIERHENDQPTNKFEQKRPEQFAETFFAVAHYDGDGRVQYTFEPIGG